MDHVTRLFAQQNLHNVPVERLNSIPADDRSVAFQDLHGASEPVVETPGMIAAKLKALDEYFASSSEGKSLWAYRSEYVQRLRLRFLRASGFDVQATIERMRKYFQKMNL